MSTSVRRAGVGLLVLYALVAVVTHRLSPGPFRPLFDGFMPPPPYRWVNPPPELARDNQPPGEAVRDVPLGPDGSEVANATTADAQAIASLESRSVPPNPPDTAVRLALTPHDPATLAPLPAGLRPLSNAYRVTLVYQPSETPVTQLAKDGTVALSASTTGDRLLYSPTGTEWQEKPSRPFGATHGRFTNLQTTGYYLVAGPPAPPATPDEGSSRTNAVLLVIATLAPIVGAALVLRPPAPAAAGPARTGASGRPQPRSRPAAKKRRRRS